METIKTPKEQALEIDRKKRVLEARANVRFRKLFNAMADEISVILLNSTVIDERKIAENYKPDFIGALRLTYRETIKAFGFELRKQIEKKHNINFHLKQEIERLETKQEFETTEDQEEQINRDYFLAITLFINNQSERQANIITQTNAKEITSNIDKSVGEYNLMLADTIDKQNSIQEQLRNISNEISVGRATEKDKVKLEQELDKLFKREEKLLENRKKIVSKGFKKNFKERGKVRSEVISEFEVGQTESFIREKEAKILDKVVLGSVILSIKKNWVSVGDSRVREAHQIADATYHFNPIPIEEEFLVGGERLDRARDTKGSPSNILGCRCINTFSIVNPVE
jgi:hypothetical protein